MNDELELTGERFVPGAAGEIWYEHWHRYLFASPLVSGCEVLDLACGEGYGSALLARSARRVTGADVASGVIAHARARYASQANLAFHEADCTALPFADGSFDAVVSFETIEHVAAQQTFLNEVRRVLRSDGLFILSCPNKVEYTDKRSVVNAFHVRELYRDELSALLAPSFEYSAWYGQRPSFYSVLWPESGSANAEIFEVSEPQADTPSPGHARPLYFIVIASSNAASIARVAPRLSVLADRDENVYRDYENVTRAVDVVQKQCRQGLAELSDEIAKLRAGLAHAEALVAERNEEIAKLRSGLAHAESLVAKHGAELERTRGSRLRRYLAFLLKKT
jgi:ubiquinone/menaquinone biosynthesis C-methylase UbiE